LRQPGEHGPRRKRRIQTIRTAIFSGIDAAVEKKIGATRKTLLDLNLKYAALLKHSGKQSLYYPRCAKATQDNSRRLAAQVEISDLVLRDVIDGLTDFSIINSHASAASCDGGLQVTNNNISNANTPAIRASRLFFKKRHLQIMETSSPEKE